MPRKVDIELKDMADQLGVGLRRLMAGVQTGRFTEHVTEDDLVYGDKGDPLFFRIDQNRAYGICGSDLPDVEKDMSTVEKMSSSTEETTEQVSTSVQTHSRTGNLPATGAGSNPPSTTSSGQTEVQSRESGSSSGVGDFLFWAGAAAVGAAVWGALSEDDSLTREQYEQIRLEGVKARLDGSTVNPYADNPEARDAFRDGWWTTDTKMREQIALSNGVSVGGTT